jgi:hypothetical protein
MGQRDMQRHLRLLVGCSICIVQRSIQHGNHVAATNG